MRVLTWIESVHIAAPAARVAALLCAVATAAVARPLDAQRSRFPWELGHTRAALPLPGADQLTGVAPVHGAVLVGVDTLMVVDPEVGGVRRYVIGDGSIAASSRSVVTAGVARPLLLGAAAGRFFALDRARGVVRMDVSGRTGIQPSGDVGASPDDLCAMRDQVVLFSGKAGGTLEYRTDQMHLRQRIDVSDSLTRLPSGSALASAHVVCDTARGRVVLVSRHQGYLRAYDAAGRAQWRAPLLGARRLDVQMVSATTSVSSIPPAGYHETVAAFVLDDRHLIVQLGLVTRESLRRNEYAGFDTRLLGLADGAEIARTDALPRLVTGAGSVAVISTPAGLVVRAARLRGSVTRQARPTGGSDVDRQ